MQTHLFKIQFTKNLFSSLTHTHTILIIAKKGSLKKPGNKCVVVLNQIPEVQFKYKQNI